MLTYVLLGRERPWAMVNAFWIAVDVGGIRPERVTVLAHGSHKAVVESVLPSFSLIAKGFGFACEASMQIVSETDMAQALARIVQTFKEAKAQGDVVLDITPARKYLASIALRAAQIESVTRVLYAHLRKLEFGDVAYPLIPFTLHESCDLGALKP